MSSSKREPRLVRFLSENPNWKEYVDDDEIFIQELPKVELHVHLDGSFDPLKLWDYMKDHPESLLCFPTETVNPWDPEKPLKIRQLIQDCNKSQDFHELCTCRGYRSLREMLNCFSIFLPLVRRNLPLLEELAYDFCQRQYEQNIVYTEVRYSPFLLAESFEEEAEGNEVDGEAVFEAITRGLRKGTKKFGIIVNQILSAIAFGPSWAMPTIALVQKHRNNFPCATVGIDIAAGEEHFDAENHAGLHGPHLEMIEKAKELNIPITLHAGESSTNATNNVKLAVEQYGASRIGHGYRAVKEETIMAECRSRSIHFEICPTSSDETGGWEYENKKWNEHPCVTMRDQELSYSLSSDDPAVFHTSLAWQYRLALVKMGLTREDLVRSNFNAIEAAFVDESEKIRLRETLQSFRDTFCGHGEVTKRGWKKSKSDTFVDRVFVKQESGSESVYF